MERWKDIPGFEGRYQASTLGRIRSLDRVLSFPSYVTTSGKHKAGSLRKFKGRILKPAAHKSGHLMVMLGRKNNKDVHVAVAETFIGPKPLNKEVLHLNHDPADNRLVNLRYGTRSENILMDLQDGRRENLHHNFRGKRK